MFHKYIVPLISVSISWCSPGVEFSLRLLKPCAGDNKSIYFVKVCLSDFSLPVHVVQQCFDMICLQTHSSSPLLQLCLFRLFQPLQKFLPIYHKNFPPRPLHNPMLTISNTTGSASNSRAVTLSFRTILLPTFFTELLCSNIATTLSTLEPPERKLYNRHFLFHFALANSLQ